MKLNLPPGNGKIYIFSNVPYPPARRIKPEPGDTLVFLNRALSAPYYADVPEGVAKLAFRRKRESWNFGNEVPGCRNFCVLWDLGVPAVREISEKYEWRRPEGGTFRSMTTGYMVTEYLAARFPEKHIVLVNFGGEVRHSTFRSPDHNWEFEAQSLKKYKHISTEEEE